MKAGRFAYQVVKRNGGLFPAGLYAQRMMDEIPDGKHLLVEAKTARNMAQHGLYWVLITELCNAGCFPDAELLHRELLRAAGKLEPYTGLDGTTQYKVRSMAISAMPREEFEEYFKRALEIIVAQFFGRMDSAQRKHFQDLMDGELGRRSASGGR
jgi:hypothetical protein